MNNRLIKKPGRIKPDIGGVNLARRAKRQPPSLMSKESRKEALICPALFALLIDCFLGHQINDSEWPLPLFLLWCEWYQFSEVLMSFFPASDDVIFQRARWDEFSSSKFNASQDKCSTRLKSIILVVSIALTARSINSCRIFVSRYWWRVIFIWIRRDVRAVITLIVAATSC